MAPRHTGPPGGRMAGLLRHLTEDLERERAERHTFEERLARLLDTPPAAAPSAWLEHALAAAPSVDAAALLVLDGEGGGGGLALRAGVGLDPGDPRGAGGGLAAGGLPERALASGRPALGPAELPLPPGTLLGCAVPLLGHAGPLGVVLFGSRSARDLPAAELALLRVAAERAARALEVARTSLALARALQDAERTGGFHDQVLGIVGHDLRNPLGAIVMSAALLQKRGGLAGWQARTVDRVRSSALRMGRIIDDLLSYTRTRLGSGIPIARRPTDLADVARRMVEELCAVHPDARVELAVGGDLAGHWDPDRLEQVVSNLVSNAIDHGDPAQPIRVSAQAEGGLVRLEVVSAGEMPREALEHAFEAFHRPPEGTGRKASGLGLGLYIAREIVQRHGGRIALSSGEDSTRIAVELPRTTAAAPATLQRS